MTLEDFILDRMEDILAEWQQFAETLPPTIGMDKKTLRNQAKDILEAIAQDMREAQSREEQEEKSKEGRF